MQERAQLVLMVGGVVCLLALIHLQLAAWLFPSWLALYPRGNERDRPAALGLALTFLAWVAAAVILSKGFESVLWWVPESSGFIDGSGDFQSWVGYLSAGFGLFAGTGWVWSVLRAGRSTKR